MRSSATRSRSSPGSIGRRWACLIRTRLPRRRSSATARSARAAIRRSDTGSLWSGRASVVEDGMSDEFEVYWSAGNGKGWPQREVIARLKETVGFPERNLRWSGAWAAVSD